MQKILLNDNPFLLTTEDLVRNLEEHGVTCERKTNGNIWARSDPRAWRDVEEIKETVYEIFREHIGQFHQTGVDYAFFDHPGWYTAKGGTTVAVFSPYWGNLHWPPLIPYMWEKGYYVSTFHGTAFVRKRREEDTLFVPTEEGPIRPMQTMDFTKFAE